MTRKRYFSPFLDHLLDDFSNPNPFRAQLVLTADFNTPRPKVFDGGFTFSYPDRSFSGSFGLDIPGPLYRGNVSIGWSANDVIHFAFVSGTSLDTFKKVFLESVLETPFAGWHHNSLDFHSLQGKNYLSSNASVLWADTQRLGFGIYTDIDLTEPDIRLEAKVNVSSTVKDFPSIDAHFKHDQSDRSYKTNVLFRHAPSDALPNVYSIRSAWELDFTALQKNVTGSINLKSPLEDFSTGTLATKFSLSSNNLLQGAAGLELSGRKYTLSVKGSVKKITDCMLEVNITTPIDKYRHIKGRFGLVDVKKHFVAELRAPYAALGVEIKFAVQNISNFDIIFNVETPITKFEKAMVIANYNPEVIDFRGGMQNFTLGYVAVTRRASLEDFEYSWKVFTPIPMYEESSLVVKYIRRKVFELEVMLKLAQKQIGIDVDCASKHSFVILPIVNSFQFKSKLADVAERFMKHYKMRIAEDMAENEEIDGEADGGAEEEEEEEEPEEKGSAGGEEKEDSFDWNFEGHMTLETIIWPTISGNIDVDNVDNDDYFVTGNLNLPQGVIDFRDHLYFYDYFKIQNSLRIETPSPAFNEVEFLYSHSVDMKSFYISSVEVLYKNKQKQQWNHLGYSSNYTKMIDVTDAKTFALDLNIFLPFEKLPKVCFGSVMEIEENLLKANVSAGTNDTSISLAGSLDHDVNFFDVAAGIHIDAPTLRNYNFKVVLKKDFSDAENVVVVGFEEDKGSPEPSKFEIQTLWQADSSCFKLNQKLNTTIFPVKVLDLSFFLNRTENFDSTLDLRYTGLSGAPYAYYASASRYKDQIRLDMNTPLPDFANISVSGSFKAHSQPGKYEMNGRLFRNNEIYNYEGSVRMDGKLPVEMDVEFKPVSRNAVGYLTYSLQRQRAGTTYHLKISENDKFIGLDGTITFYSKFKWDFFTRMTASPELLRHRCEVNASVNVADSGRVHGYTHVMTPWRHLGIDSVTLNGSLLMNGHVGDVSVDYDFSLANGKTSCAWHFVLLENMDVMLDSHTNIAELGPRDIRFAARYLNPGKNFARLNLGGDFKVDDAWSVNTNGTLNRNGSVIMATLGINMPKPHNDLHFFFGEVESELLSNMQASFKDARYVAKYESQHDRTRFSSRGLYRNGTDLQALLQAQWGNTVATQSFESNFQMLRKNEKREFYAKIKTPKDREDTITANGGFEKRGSTFFVK